jgi:hypothetical protein
LKASQLDLYARILSPQKTYLFAGLNFALSCGKMATTNMRSRRVMSKQLTNPSSDCGDHRVYVGALVPLRLYTLLVEEAEQASVSRSEVLRRALADRYDYRQGAIRED